MIGIVVIGGAIYVLGAILAGLAGVANSVWSSTCDILGRKSLGCVAFIPEGLGANEDPLPKKDPDREELMAYSPGEDKPLRRARSVFLPVPEPESAPREASRTIDIAREPEILAMSDDLPFGRLAAVPSISAYPVQKPGGLEPAAPVPHWTPWWPSFEDASFDHPLWRGALSFLNRFVEEAHKDEAAKALAANARKAELIVRCDERNKAVSELAEMRGSIVQPAKAISIHPKGQRHPIR